jgi:hypothetical protein
MMIKSKKYITYYNSYYDDKTKIKFFFIKGTYKALLKLNSYCSIFFLGSIS